MSGAACDYCGGGMVDVGRWWPLCVFLCAFDAKVSSMLQRGGVVRLPRWGGLLLNAGAVYK